MANSKKGSTTETELEKCTAEMQNLSSRACDSAQALEFLHRNKIQFLLDVETFLEELGEIKDEIYAGTNDFMLSLQDSQM